MTARWGGLEADVRHRMRGHRRREIGMIVSTLLLTVIFIGGAFVVAVRIGQVAKNDESLITTTDHPLAPILVERPDALELAGDTVRFILVGKLSGHDRELHLSYTCTPSPRKGDR